MSEGKSNANSMNVDKSKPAVQLQLLGGALAVPTPCEIDDSWADAVRGRPSAATRPAARARVLQGHGTGSRSPRGGARADPTTGLELGPVSRDGKGLLLSANCLATITGIDSRKELAVSTTQGH